MVLKTGCRALLMRPLFFNRRLLVTSSVPLDFGAPNGSTISNKASVLSEVDVVLETNRPPDLEVVSSKYNDTQQI